jgi:hypothetical protein
MNAAERYLQKMQARWADDGKPKSVRESVARAPNITEPVHHLGSRARCDGCGGLVFTYSDVSESDGRIVGHLCSPCTVVRKGGHVCNCGRTVHIDPVGRVIHSDGRSYNHPAVIVR